MKSSTCPLQLALQQIGGKWKLVIIWHLLERPQRFNELKRTIGSISTKVLSDQLNQLIAIDLVSRTIIPNKPPQVEYRVTKKGDKLRDLIELVYAWGVEHVKE